MGQALRPGEGARHLCDRTNEPLLHGVGDFKIVREDTLRSPAFYTGNNLAQFDCVIANPPFSLKNWGEPEWASDKWGRNALGGVPPKGYADWAWVQHMLTSAKPKTGRVAVVLPQGALFRQGAEARIRTHVLKSDLVDAVIGLAPNLFYGTGLAACADPSTGEATRREGKVLFINGEDLFKRGRNRTPSNEHAQQILNARLYADFEGRSRVVDLAGSSNGYNLNIAVRRPS